jgi:hypothetical protein
MLAIERLSAQTDNEKNPWFSRVRNLRVFVPALTRSSTSCFPLRVRHGNVVPVTIEDEFCADLEVGGIFQLWRNFPMKVVRLYQ